MFLLRVIRDFFSDRGSSFIKYTNVFILSGFLYTTVYYITHETEPDMCVQKIDSKTGLVETVYQTIEGAKNRVVQTVEKVVPSRKSLKTGISYQYIHDNKYPSSGVLIERELIGIFNLRLKAGIGAQYNKNNGITPQLSIGINF